MTLKPIPNLKTLKSIFMIAMSIVLSVYGNPLNLVTILQALESPDRGYVNPSPLGDG
jgi:hypothetical protein